MEEVKEKPQVESTQPSNRECNRPKTTKFEAEKFQNTQLKAKSVLDWVQKFIDELKPSKKVK